MSAFGRGSTSKTSKFRFVYCDSPRADQTWTGLKLSGTTGEQSYIKANSKYFAVAWQGGGGPFTVFDIDKPGRADTQCIMNGQSGPLTDFDFNPHNEQQIATISEDFTVKLWDIPTDGLKENITSATADIGSHKKKGLMCRWNPVASGVLASAGADMSVKLWDVRNCKEISSLDAHNELILDLQWDYMGSSFATTSRDKDVRIVDARSMTITNMIKTAHDGNKSAKLTYCGTLDMLCTVGFVKGSSKRQFKLWDPRNTSAPCEQKDLDDSAGVVMPFFDADTNMIYFIGKGEGQVKYFELGSDTPMIMDCNTYRSTVSAKGACIVPKRVCDVEKNEMARILKLTTNSVEPLRFYIPRKGTEFQDDLYPDTLAGEPSMSCDEWLSGSSKAPRVMSLNPSGSRASYEMDINSIRSSTASAMGGGSSLKYVAPKTAMELQTELNAANAKIASLEAKLKLHGIN
jgi:coronin-1B/1C/6